MGDSYWSWVVTMKPTAYGRYSEYLGDYCQFMLTELVHGRYADLLSVPI